jgi:hypothetical protein
MREASGGKITQEQAEKRIRTAVLKGEQQDSERTR